MKRMELFGAALGLAVIAGCASHKSSPSASAIETNSQVTHVTPPPTPTVTPAPAPADTAETVTPAPSDTVTPAVPVTSGQSYTIRKGDTLYSIAKAHYGTGKAVNKILEANPGISPTHLKIGQVITLP